VETEPEIEPESSYGSYTEGQYQYELIGEDCSGQHVSANGKVTTIASATQLSGVELLQQLGVQEGYPLYLVLYLRRDGMDHSAGGEGIKSSAEMQEAGSFHYSMQDVPDAGDGDGESSAEPTVELDEGEELFEPTEPVVEVAPAADEEAPEDNYYYDAEDIRCTGEAEGDLQITLGFTGQYATLAISSLHSKPVLEQAMTAVIVSTLNSAWSASAAATGGSSETIGNELRNVETEDIAICQTVVTNSVGVTEAESGEAKTSVVVNFRGAEATAQSSSLEAAMVYDAHFVQATLRSRLYEMVSECIFI
jgi:hypothetical protein